jgi:hypothetical protein
MDEAYTSYLPPLYARWLGELLRERIPDETLATCGDCAMCSKAKVQPRGFHPDVKCCTYIPTVPNFLLGGILADDDPATAGGRETMVKRLATGVSVTPLGVAASPTEDLVSSQLARHQAFGKLSAIRCPHLSADGLCGIYKQRNAVCATFHCKHVRGAVGHDFWMRTRHLLLRIESLLSRWCVLRLQTDPEALRLLFHEEQAKADVEKAGSISGVMAPELARRMWGVWYGREHDFYRECGRLVAKLSMTDVVATCGPEVEAHAQFVAHAFAKLVSDDLPSSLRLGPLNVSYIAADYTAVWTYSSYDPISLPKPLVDVLHRFDGRPTTDVLKEILEHDDVDIDEGLVSKLVDYRVLVDAGE